MMLAMILALILKGDIHPYKPPTLDEIRHAFSPEVINSMESGRVGNSSYYHRLYQYMVEVEDFPHRDEWEEIMVESLSHLKDFIALKEREDVCEKRIIIEDRMNLFKRSLYAMKSLHTNKDLHFRILDIVESLEKQMLEDASQTEELYKYNQYIAIYCYSYARVCRKRAYFNLRENISPEEWESFWKVFEERARAIENRMRPLQNPFNSREESSNKTRKNDALSN